MNKYNVTLEKYYMSGSIVKTLHVFYGKSEDTVRNAIADKMEDEEVLEDYEYTIEKVEACKDEQLL